MIVVALVSVNHDGKGGTAPDPLVWDQGAGLRFVSLLSRLMLILLLLLALLVFFITLGFRSLLVITGADIAAWSYSVSVMIRFTSFLATLHWPSGAEDFGHFGISFLELLILFEQWAGHRLLSEKVT